MILYRAYLRKRRLLVRFAWYDLWIGAFWDRREHVLYVCPLPTLLFELWSAERHPWR